MSNKDELLKKMETLRHQPAGKKATKIILDLLGSAPFAGGATAAVGNKWREKEQDAYNKVIHEWASKTDDEIDEISRKIDALVNEPTKAKMVLILGEIMGADTVDEILSGDRDNVSMILNGETVGELQPFVQKGWIEIKPNGNICGMGAGNRIDNSIEDKKRPWGMGSGFVISIPE